MRDAIEQGLAWALVLGLVCAVVLGRRRGRDRVQAQIASARAEGRAELTAELASLATATQSVNVAVDASRRGGDELGHDAAACLDPWGCAVCSPVLLRVARSHGVGVGFGSAVELGTAQLGSADDDRGNVRRYDELDRSALRGVPVERIGDRAAAGGGPGRVADRGRVLDPAAQAVE